MKKQRGITLIALIITIVILVILAVVAIREVQGGIITKAKEAVEKIEKARIDEEIQRMIISTSNDLITRKVNLQSLAANLKNIDGIVSIIPEVEDINTETKSIIVIDKYERQIIINSDGTIGEKLYEMSAVEASEIFDYTINNEKCTINYLKNRESTSVIVPDKIDGCYVTKVTLGGAYQTFHYWPTDLTNLVSVTLPRHLEQIGDYAFYNCSNLTTLNIPEEIEVIGAYAFSNCINITELTLPESLTYISYCGISGCSITTLTLPSKVVVEGINNNPIFSSSLEEINVSVDNTYYTSQNGVLYNKDKTQILVYPIKKPDTSFEIPRTITSLSSSSNFFSTNLTSLIVNKQEGEWLGAPWGATNATITYTVPGVYEEPIVGKDIMTEEEANPIFEYGLYSGTYSVSGVKDLNLRGHLIIPSKIGGIDVTRINTNDGFSGGRYLKSIQIPSTVSTFTMFWANDMLGIGANNGGQQLYLQEIKIDNIENAISGAPWGLPSSITITWLR